jgi:molybdenum cofactor cytidylyltransferase
MIAGLILAAGESSRMGTDKALLAYRSRTFLETIIGTLRQAGIEHVAVVLGHHANEIQRAIDLAGTEVVINQDYRRGQTSSLQAGLRAFHNTDAKPHQEIEAVVLCLVDHPAISAEITEQLIAAFRKSHAPVMIPTYQGQRGHPVLITRAVCSELLTMDSNKGANTVIRSYRDATHFVEVDDSGILLDIDDSEAYRRLSEV